MLNFWNDQWDIILIDIDGTLVDSNDLHAQSWHTILVEAGYSVSYDQVRKLIGKGSDKLVPELTGLSASSPAVEALSQRRQSLFLDSYAAKVEAWPYAKELVEWFIHRGYKVVLATSAAESESDAVLKAANLDLWDLPRTTANDAVDSKPAPDILQAALNLVQGKPENAVLIGDTPYDIEAAKRAKISCLALTCGGWNKEALVEAIAVCNDPKDPLDQLCQESAAG